jgi:hypothetical protein
VIRWLLDKWHAHQRSIDLAILWPECCKQSGPDLTYAKTAFAFHCFNDSAWLCLGEQRICEIIDGLEHPL